MKDLIRETQDYKMVQGLSAVEPWLCSVSVKLFGILSRGSCMAKWLNKLCLQHLKYALLAQWWCLTFSILWTWECVHKPICVCVHIYIYECVHSKVDCLVSSFSYHTNVRKWVLYHTQDLVHHQCIHQHISNSVLSHQGRASELLRVKLWVTISNTPTRKQVVVPSGAGVVAPAW